MKPVFQSASTSQAPEEVELRPGTSGSSQKMETEEKEVEKYKSTEKAMIMGPDGKIIPFVTLDRMSKDDQEGKGEKSLRRILTHPNIDVFCRNKNQIYV